MKVLITPPIYVSKSKLKWIPFDKLSSWMRCNRPISSSFICTSKNLRSWFAVFSSRVTSGWDTMESDETTLLICFDLHWRKIQRKNWTKKMLRLRAIFCYKTFILLIDSRKIWTNMTFYTIVIGLIYNRWRRFETLYKFICLWIVSHNRKIDFLDEKINQQSLFPYLKSRYNWSFKRM